MNSLVAELLQDPALPATWSSDSVKAQVFHGEVIVPAPTLNKDPQTSGHLLELQDAHAKIQGFVMP